MKIMVLTLIGFMVASASTSSPPQPTSVSVTDPEPTAVTSVTPSATSATVSGKGSPTQQQGTSQPSVQGTSAPSTQGPEPSAVLNAPRTSSGNVIQSTATVVQGTAPPQSTSGIVSQGKGSTAVPEPSAVQIQPSTSNPTGSPALDTTQVLNVANPSTSSVEPNQVVRTTSSQDVSTQTPVVQTTGAPQTTYIPQTTAAPVSVTTVTFAGVTAESFADNQADINLGFFNTMKINLPSLTNVSQIESEIVNRRRRLLSGVAVAFKIKGLSKNDVQQSAQETSKGNFAAALATEVSNRTPLTVQVSGVVTVVIIATTPPPVVPGTTVGTVATTMAATTGKPIMKTTIIPVAESSSNVGAILGGLFGAFVFIAIVYYVYTTQCANEPYNEFDADPEKNGPCDHVQMSDRNGKSVYLD